MKHATFRPLRSDTCLERGLLYLAEHKGATPEELAEVMGCKQGAISSHLQRAMNYGLVERGFYLTKIGVQWSLTKDKGEKK